MKESSSTMIHGSGRSGRFALWFGLGIVLSMAAHIVFLERSRDWKVAGFSPESYDMIVPRTFRMKHVEIDPATLEEPVKELPDKKREQRPVELPPETPDLDSRKAGVGTSTSVMKGPLPENDLPTAEEIRAGTDAPRLDEKTMNQLMEGNRNAPRILVDPLKEPAERTGGAEPSPAFSSLDALLEEKEKLTSATAPILMPTDLLFGYDSTALKPEAAKSLGKLGTLIMRNGGARFRIEGHTDSFGSADYNVSLSLRRAEEVKAWLVRTMGIDPSRITTAGLGKTRLLVPGTGSISDQQLNRRVEIVITGVPTP